MKPSSYCKDTFLSLANTTCILFYTTCLATLFTFYLIYYPINITYTSNIQDYNQISNFTQPENGKSNHKSSDKCDLFKGQWIQDERGPLYTNYSCKTIPLQRNCFLNGRKDRDFLHWKWKPDQCELPRFNAETFLSILQGKTMAFVGDSLARNHMESLLCLLSTVETPKAIQEDTEEDKSATWEFPKHNFTLMVFWSQFLVQSTEKVINGSATGSFDIQLDKIDKKWSKKLPIMDYVIFSDAHWFPREHDLYEADKHVGCVYCQKPNVTVLGPGPAIQKAFRAAFEEINSCKNCKKVFTLLRTFSPSQFENGEWNTGGVCNRTRLVERDEVAREGYDWETRKIQVEEIEVARKLGEKSGNIFEILDVTEMMLMRPDGHPDVYWGNTWNGYSDCIHWCLPGPIDVWNELLLEVIRRRLLT
ncbi:hypothetical protein RD792_004249 [Penstemon davidsonii]|uniref:Trichome birefringence-like N-terminal domain-containing protein n=1 Tax=Penstemon davidsonii TaxID=160366 RepID=A0ABR0DHP8_9LAMI|nr:hypothetical protein RD792_004249 [Penstemon davidsonii]